jgi:hypothetical protein
MPREWAAFRPHALPIITVRRDPWAVRALIDTGAQISLIHPRLVLQLGLPTIGDLSLVGLGSVVLRVPRVRIEGFHIARLPLQACEAGIFNLDPLRLGIDLTLGINAFEGYRLQSDFAAGRLFLLTLRA